MKLYTEKQLLNAIEFGIKEAGCFGVISNQDYINSLKAIQLPTEDEIEKKCKYIAHNYFEMHNTNHYQGLEKGAQLMAEWIKEKILK